MTHAQETAGPGNSRARSPVPRPAVLLGAGGAIPFAALAILAFLGPADWSDWAGRALAFYGAVILSFLGGIQWGLAIAADPALPENSLRRRLATSVVPSLIGWGALLLVNQIGLVVMAASFALVLVFDVQAAMKGEAPGWYPKLRIPLSAVVIVCLVTGALA